MRFDVINTTRLRSLYAFGVTQEEDFDERLHTDGREEEDRTTRNTRGKVISVAKVGQLDLRVVKKDFFDGRDIVQDRIQWLITQVQEIVSMVHTGDRLTKHRRIVLTKQDGTHPTRCGNSATSMWTIEQ